MRILSTLLKIGPKREFGKIKLNSWNDNIKWFVFISGGSSSSIFFCNCLTLDFWSHKNYTEPYYKEKSRAKHPQGSGTFHLVSLEILNSQKKSARIYEPTRNIFNIALTKCFEIRKFLSGLFRNSHFTKDCKAEYQNKKDIWCYTYNSRLEI